MYIYILYRKYMCRKIWFQNQKNQVPPKTRENQDLKKIWFSAGFENHDPKKTWFEYGFENQDLKKNLVLSGFLSGSNH